MNLKKLGIILTATSLITLSMVGCSDEKETNTDNAQETTQQEDTKAEDTKAEDTKENAMQYVSKEDLKESTASKDYVILDVRKSEDYNKSHIDGAYVADQDAANKGGDDAAGIVNLKTALKEATGSEVGNADEKYALVCYSGKSYAQKATDLMIEMGISKDQIYTLEGGMEDWEKGGDEYKALLK